MAFLNRLDPKPISDDDDLDARPIFVASTSPGTDAATAVELLDDLDPLSAGHPPGESAVPWPGRTFMIRHADSGRVITLRDGQVVLAAAGDHSSTHWRCVEAKGWLGFRSPVSGKYLGHDAAGRLRCAADRHLAWEFFCVRRRPDRGYVLLMTHFERLWPIGVQSTQGAERLAKVDREPADGLVWEFVPVWSDPGLPP